MFKGRGTFFIWGFRVLARLAIVSPEEIKFVELKSFVIESRTKERLRVEKRNDFNSEFYFREAGQMRSLSVCACSVCAWEWVVECQSISSVVVPILVRSSVERFPFRQHSAVTIGDSLFFHRVGVTR